MIYFLSSLPRSGSTLLSSILNQHPDVYVSPTSGLCDTMGAAITSWERNPATHASQHIVDDGLRMLKGLADAYYANREEKFIIDKGRGWPAPGIISTMEKIQGDVKIITTVRPIRECLASFIKLCKPDDVYEFFKSQLVQHLFSSYNNLKAGYEAYPNKFLIIEYDELVKNPQKQLDRISKFLLLPKFQFNFENIQEVNENDKIWGIKNLHKVRKKIRKQKYDGKKLLGNELWEYYSGGEFWKKITAIKKEPHLLDIQLEAGLRGDFEKGWEISEILHKQGNERAEFNRGWYLLRQGKLQEGHKLLDKGRKYNVFGNQHIGSTQPIWDGSSNGIILLNLEGGLGDQIHGVRWAKDISERNNKVIVACSAELAPLFIDVRGVSAVVQHEAALGVYHTSWLPSMSAVIPLKYEYKDLDGNPYIKRFGKSKGKIGLRWAGNPEFEHEQHRLFPSKLLFDAVKGYDCISLQRDKGREECPDWVETVPLDTWIDTAKAISSCDLVISSCTSVAHLSAAMGIETWIIVPILSYYLWALPTNKSPYYNSVTLFRQQQYGDWSHPFDDLKKELKLINKV